MSSLSLVVPVYVVDGGAAVASVAGYWRSLLEGQRKEIEATFGVVLWLPGEGTDTTAIDSLPTPAVLVVPALGGGRIPADPTGWHDFRGRLARFRDRGGVVVLYEVAFHLPGENRKTAGRNWQGMEHHPGEAPYVREQVRVHRADEDAPVLHAEFATPWHVWGEWRRREGHDGRAQVIAWAEKPGADVPLAWRWERRLGWEQPGSMVFLTSWAWVHHQRKEGTDWAIAPENQVSLDSIFAFYRGLNRDLTLASVRRAQGRLRQRLLRMEKLAGATERLPNRAGKEKDYHRLLVNDAALCVDLVSWRADLSPPDADSVDFRRRFRHAVVHNEPGYEKTAGKGRLDILLTSHGDADRVGEDQAVVPLEGRAPVAWIELEAGGLHEAQMRDFLAGHGAKFQHGDFVVAVDRSAADAPAVVRIGEAVRARGLRFLHVQVPEAFDGLEEAYAPALHALSRKRYSLEVIRGLLG